MRIKFSGNSGFSMVETVIAIVVVMVGLLSLFAVLPQVLRDYREAENMGQISNVLRFASQMISTNSAVTIDPNSLVPDKTGKLTVQTVSSSENNNQIHIQLSKGRSDWVWEVQSAIESP